MATTTFYLKSIKNNWWITYLFQTDAGYGYTITLKNSTGNMLKIQQCNM
ncbi:conserved hypothetical protein [Xenorhabdus innexi]|uniref:Uncharacterized protein n=1 Tax=Xenorhabdus innexi TaxID=290109 RepID=A0A1N6N1H7_9GAMM|nr:hypothetical protein Xinn_03714 [Xenorhabdus innexi]SIP74963.1 conserved hypothetical protein [Xenorhabdus innexi]